MQGDHLEREQRAEEETVEPAWLTRIGKRTGARVGDARIGDTGRRHGVVGSDVIRADEAGNPAVAQVNVEPNSRSVADRAPPDRAAAERGPKTFPTGMSTERDQWLTKNAPTKEDAFDANVMKSVKKQAASFGVTY